MVAIMVTERCCVRQKFLLLKVIFIVMRRLNDGGTELDGSIEKGFNLALMV
jgi:hypothetical protein